DRAGGKVTRIQGSLETVVDRESLLVNPLTRYQAPLMLRSLSVVGSHLPRDPGRISLDVDGYCDSDVTFIDPATISARSRTWKSSWAPTPRMPSSNIVMQNGQAAHSTSAPVSIASRTRAWLMRSPRCSSMNMRPPPPPQQKLRLRLRAIATSSTPASAPTAWRGASYTWWERPR